MPKSTRLIPPIHQLQTEATAILAERDADAVHERLRSFLAYYDAVNFRLSYGAPLWRARQCPNRMGFSKITDVHYPPPNNTPANRLNEPGSPMLYVSFTQFTAFQEVEAKPGDFVQLIGYSMNDPVRSLLLGEFNNVHKRGQCSLPGLLSEELNRILNGMSFSAGLSLVFMDAFLSAILSNPASAQRDHLHSRTLVKLLLDEHPGIEAIHYPSVAREGSMNLAIKPAVADKALRVAGTSVVYIETQYDYRVYDFKIVRDANIVGDVKRVSEVGEIEWRELDYKPG